MKEKVFMTRLVAGNAVDRIAASCALDLWPGENPPSREVILERIRGCSGLFSLLTDTIDATVMDAAGGGFKVISNYAVGFDNIDVAAATHRGISVGNTPGVLTETTADLAFALLMSAARRIVEGVDFVRAGGFHSWSPTMLLGCDIHGSTLGILGMGRIGRAMARRGSGFGMRVIYSSPSHLEASPMYKAQRVSFEELIERADFLSLHVPLMEETRHLINRETLALMKPTAVLINTARGAVVDHSALHAALVERQIAYAALDVTEPEPLPAGHPLLGLANCIVVPHLGSGSLATRIRMANMAADNLIAGLRGDRLPNSVNPEVYK